MGKIKTVNNVDEILTDLKDLKYELEKVLPTKAKEDIILAHKQIIAEFYDSYNPKIYYRGDEFKKTLVSARKDHNLLTVIVGSDKMRDNHYGYGGKKIIDKDFVFANFWHDGVRGLPYSEETTGTGWINPNYMMYRVGDNGGVSVGSDNVNQGRPVEALNKFIEQWGQANGEKYANNIFKSICK